MASVFSPEVQDITKKKIIKGMIEYLEKEEDKEFDRAIVHGPNKPAVEERPAVDEQEEDDFRRQKGWWPVLAQAIDVRLREIGVIPKHSFIIGRNISSRQIENKLRILKKHSCTAIVLCLPADETGRAVLKAIDSLHIAQDHNTLTVLMDASNFPPWQNVLQSLPSNGTSIDNNTYLTSQHIEKVTRQYILVFSDELNFNKSMDDIVRFNLKSTFLACDSKLNDVARNDSVTRNDSVVRNDSVARNDSVLRNDLVIRTDSSPRNDFCDDTHPLRVSNFYIADLLQDDSPRLLIKLSRRGNLSDFTLTRITDSLEEWIIKHKRFEECEGCENDIMKIISVLLILGSSCVFLIVLLGVVAFARTQLLRKKVTKGPYKVILTATDFVFPQISDKRRVEEGIEAMLCCWLEQLQEFGVTDIEKPDLLLGSGTSGRTPSRAGGSSPNLAKQIIVDPRVRYNGDLVQMKPVPFSGSSGGEIKDKAIELLLLLHGLRHENLNPLIGCLAEAPRAALVSEYCARGSLQDVLQQDDIKLDWSFRLSLLTDLVRQLLKCQSSKCYAGNDTVLCGCYKKTQVSDVPNEKRKPPTTELEASFAVLITSYEREYAR
ncbi:hypothetical protein WA026_006738 [Henosepilachna vigintioctopunctata]|uniref:guanylate cyclase n=1 Tax=Henosepilachna vigintioctopunctata TaxID=420089 RepID=A0AAW1UHL3_9CUCU